MIAVVFIMFWIDGDKKPSAGEVINHTSSERGALEVREDDWTKGNPDAKLVIVKYSDFNCPACRFYASFDEYLNEVMGDSVLFVFRHFPLRNSPVSMKAARFAEAAGRQGKFWEMHDLIYINQKMWKQGHPDEVFSQFVQHLGLDVGQFSEDVNDSTLIDGITADYNEGRELGITSVPTIFMDGKKITNPGSLQEYRSLIEANLEN